MRGLRKSFGAKRVLDGVDLDVAAGSTTVVIGASGSGKSVLLKCILGLMAPDSGTIEIDGRDILALTATERDHVRSGIGMLFQNGALFDSLPVWENVTFGLLAQRAVTRRAARGRAGEFLAQVGLEESVGDLYPAELSGGMQKRVALARAIAAKPAIMFFDEPTTGLDPIMGAVIDGLDRRLRAPPRRHRHRHHPRHGERAADRRHDRHAARRADHLVRAAVGAAGQRQPGGRSIHPRAARGADPDGAAPVARDDPSP